MMELMVGGDDHIIHGWLNGLIKRMDDEIVKLLVPWWIDEEIDGWWTDGEVIGCLVD